jgi:hypothetical protein
VLGVTATTCWTVPLPCVASPPTTTDMDSKRTCSNEHSTMEQAKVFGVLSGNCGQLT